MSIPTPDLARAIYSETIHIEIPSQPEWITPTVEHLRERAILSGVCDEEQGDKIMLALHEAITNAVIHGNLEVSSELKELGDDTFNRVVSERSSNPHYADRRVFIDVGYNQTQCQWSISDEGKGFDHEDMFHRLDTDATDLHLSSGRGLMLMRAFLDEVSFNEGGTQCVLTWNTPRGVQERAHPRRTHRQLVRVADVDKDGSIDWDNASPAFTKNLSEGGISFLQSQLVKSENVVLGLEYEGEPIYIPAHVRHCSPLQEGMVEVGCCFLYDEGGAKDKPSMDEARTVVQTILDGTLRRADGHDERRQHPRLSFTEKIRIHFENGNEVSAFAQNLSVSGVGFLTTRALPLEKVRIELPTSDGCVRFRAKIVRCTRITEGCFDLGATFMGLDSHEPVSPSEQLEGEPITP